MIDRRLLAKARSTWISSGTIGKRGTFGYSRVLPVLSERPLGTARFMKGRSEREIGAPARVPLTMLIAAFCATLWLFIGSLVMLAMNEITPGGVSLAEFARGMIAWPLRACRALIEILRILWVS